MLKNVILFSLIFFISSFIKSESMFSLKKEYEISVFIEGTNQVDINKGMKAGLTSLLVNLSGDSKIMKKGSAQKILSQPEKFVSKYTLGIKEEKIIANFVYQGDLLRSSLSQNSLPLLLSQNQYVLVFFPCRAIAINRENLQEKKMCSELEDKIIEISNLRKSNFTFPLMDLTDLNYFESLSSISINKFMRKISNRYSAESWLLCNTKDEFGLLLEKPKCKSSVNDQYLSPDFVINEILDKSNSRNSLIVNKQIKNETIIRIDSVNSFSSLENILEEIDSQILVFDTSLREIKGEAVEIEVSHFGYFKDLQYLLNINENFEEVSTDSRDIISFRYNRN